MEIILEYLYTGSIKEETLTKDNIVETFYAADYFQLSDLQNFIVETFQSTIKKNSAENYSPELLSKFAEKMLLTENNNFLNLLVETVAIIPLNTLEFGRLSIKGLQYLLSCTYEKKKLFVTPEYEVFRYSAILAAKQVSNDVCKALTERLPTLGQIKAIENSAQADSEDKPIINHQEVAKELEPLIKFIDFMRIKGVILADIIEPLEIISARIISDVYRQKARLNESDLNGIRGICNYVWDESACGTNVIIEDNGKVARLPNNVGSCRNVRAKTILGNNDIFEWDVIIENCTNAWVGVCASENLNYEFWAGRQTTGWVLGSNGNCNHLEKVVNGYCPPFGDGTKVTVHLDMNERTIAFTVNGAKYREVTEWNNLPSKLYPVVSFNYPAQFRIQPHQKN
ncbi:concanavalin A-like lectin/glucanase domain-containing protein [Rhizophagus clarus]|nr:concanavalin A-like lectin/glucanase domain-containing protein [Rhizophagus clarus]